MTGPHRTTGKSTKGPTPGHEGHEEAPGTAGARILSISLPVELLDEMDQLIGTGRYKGRSEVLRAGLREFLKAQRKEEKLVGRVNAIISLCYPEHLERAISDVRHAHNDVVTSMLHAHTVRGKCATVLVGDADHEKMKRFLAELRGLRLIDSMDVMIV